MSATGKKVSELKEFEQDFDFYPTTKEIIDRVKSDVLHFVKTSHSRSWDEIFVRANSDISNRYSHVRVPDIIDIGAGDGRVLKSFKEDENFEIENSYAIERANLQGDDLIKNGCLLIGRDFFHTTMYDKKFDIAFCNPPFSMYKEFMNKICREVNAAIIYLVLPTRWKNDPILFKTMNEKGSLEILGQYDFHNAERKARANVDLIRIFAKKGDETFKNWAEDNIGEFSENEKINLTDFEDNEEVSAIIKSGGKDIVNVLVKNYNDEMKNLIAVYQQMGKLDFTIFRQLEIDKKSVLALLKKQIQSLKEKYWNVTFDFMSEISSRITAKNRRKIIAEIKWINEMDFNESNIRSVVVWVIENYNTYTDEEVLNLYRRLTDFNSVTEYKSNEHWTTDTWRYIKDRTVPEKYKLDYRFVSPYVGSQFSRRFEYERMNEDNIIEDFSIVARKLGFENTLEEDKYVVGEKHFCYCEDLKTKDNVLFEYKIFKNGNIHFKLHKELQKRLNIEAGKLNGWLKNSEDVEKEFEVSKEEAKSFFDKNITHIDVNDVKLLPYEGK